MKRLQLSWANLANYDETAAEHRRAGRVDCEHLRCESGVVLDLSRTGARLRLRRWGRPAAGQKQCLTLQTYEGALLPLPCRVAWSRRVFLRKIEVGVEFLDLTEQQSAALSKIAMMHADRNWIHNGRDLAA